MGCILEPVGTPAFALADVERVDESSHSRGDLDWTASCVVEDTELVRPSIGCVTSASKMRRRASFSGCLHIAHGKSGLTVPHIIRQNVVHDGRPVK